MSWYFLGGFSAYAMVPSIRWENHSGCSVTHGWSGEACSARSSATSIPSSFVRATNASKSSNVPRSGWIASWPPGRGADGPGHARVVRSGHQGVVRALAERGADGVYRREVHDVESHGRHRGQPLGRGAQRARPRRVQARAFRPREELVPRADQRPAALDEQRQVRARRDELAQRVHGHQGEHGWVRGDREPLDRGEPLVDQRLGGVPQGPAVDVRRERLDRATDHRGALGELELDVDTRRELDLGPVPPRLVRVVPGLDAEAPPTGSRGTQPTGPAVLAVEGGSHPADLLDAFGRGEDQGDPEGVVALAQHRGPHGDPLLLDRLGCAAPTVDDGCHVQDREAAHVGAGHGVSDGGQRRGRAGREFGGLGWGRRGDRCQPESEHGRLRSRQGLLVGLGRRGRRRGGIDGRCRRLGRGGRSRRRDGLGRGGRLGLGRGLLRGAEERHRDRP